MEKKLVINGKYNRAAIMRRAWAYVKRPFCIQYRNDFRGALRAAWIDAKLAKDKEAAMEKWEKEGPNFPNKGLGVVGLYYSNNMINGYATR